MAQYYTLLTKIGQASVANAVALNKSVKLTSMAVGDGNGNPTTPNENQTALVRSRYSANINQLTIDPANPNYVICEMIVPTTVGGWSVNEVGVFDDVGNLIAIANFPATYKPQLSEGSGRDLIVRIYIQVSNASVITLQVDPAVVLASQAWVAANYNLAKLIPGGTTSQILAKKSNADGDTKWVDPTAAVNVIVYSVEETQTLAAGATIIDLATITTQGLGVYIEGARLRLDEFTKNSATRITLAQSRPAGTKVTCVQNDQTGVTMLARLDGADFTGPVTAPTPPQFDADTSVATTEFVKRALGSYSGYAGINASRAVAAADSGKLLYVGVPGVTITLPTPVSIGFKPGDSVTIFSSDPAGASIGPGAGATLKYDGVNSAASTLLKQGQYSAFVATTDTAWQIVHSSAELGRNPDFASSKGSTGYQKLPGGLIIQFGRANYVGPGNTTLTPTTIPFPIAFPNACVSVVATDNGGLCYAQATNAISNSQFNLYVRDLASGGIYPANAGSSFIAIGY